MLITAYTTYEDVRAALGVSEEEIGDATLALRLYEDALHADLEDVALSVPTTYATLNAQQSPSDDEQRFLQAVRLFATYSVARQLTVSVELFSPVQVGDGKAVMARNKAPHAKTVERVNEQYDKWRNRLLKLVEASSSVPRAYFAVISPDVDPITG